jgi:hypothetical protein
MSFEHHPMSFNLTEAFAVVILSPMKLSFFLIFVAISLGAHAQHVEVPELFNMLEWPHFRIDTTLKKKGYLLMQKDIDSVSSIYQYSHLDRKENKPTMVRSLVYMEVKSRESGSRLVNYRTYSFEEFGEIARWMIENGYMTRHQSDLGNAKNTVYTNGKETILVKITTTKIDSKVFTSWEIEIGK